MGALFGTTTGALTAPNYTGLQTQTAVGTLPVPIVWGLNKIAPNIIWYNGFSATPGVNGLGISSGGKGGGGAAKYGTTQEYSADVIMALCEGPIAGINQIWKGQAVYTLSDLGLGLWVGDTPQTPWSFVESSYPSQALGYNGLCYAAANSYSLGSSATLDNHDFEVQGFRYGTGYGQTGYETYVSDNEQVYAEYNLDNATAFNGNVPATGFFDADPAWCVSDFLTNAQFGVGFPAGSIDAVTLWTQGGSADASYQTYCRAVGLAMSPALINSETASSVLDRWLQITNTVAVWSGGLLRFISY